MRSTIAIAMCTLLLGACATTGGEPPQRELAGECNAADVQGRVGQRATAELGGLLLRETGARTLRWVPPRTAVTMDFRADRLTVSYDDDMVIERISCG